MEFVNPISAAGTYHMFQILLIYLFYWISGSFVINYVDRVLWLEKSKYLYFLLWVFQCFGVFVGAYFACVVIKMARSMRKTACYGTLLAVLQLVWFAYYKTSL
jgi:hypothetical protein